MKKKIKKFVTFYERELLKRYTELGFNFKLVLEELEEPLDFFSQNEV